MGNLFKILAMTDFPTFELFVLVVSLLLFFELISN